jgi:hypothetical protein
VADFVVTGPTLQNRRRTLGTGALHPFWTTTAVA